MARNLSTRLKVLLAVFLFAVVVLCVNGWVLVRNVSQLQSRQDWVEHSYAVIVEIEAVLSGVGKAETGQRGFLLTADERSVRVYESGLQEIWQHLERLKRLVRDNPVQAERVIELHNMIEAQVNRLEKHITAKRMGKAYEQQDMVAEARSGMFALRRSADLMQDSERSLLRERAQEAEHGRSVVFLTIALGMAVNLLGASATYFLVRRQIRNHALESEKKAHESRLKTAESEASALVVGDRPLSDLAKDVVRVVSEKSGAPVASLYLAKDGDLCLEATFGGALREKRKGKISAVTRYKPGEGLVGRASLMDEILEINEVPSDYFPIESGLGSALPRHLVFSPLRFQGRLVGVLELASFDRLDTDEREWLRVISGAIAAGLGSGLHRERQQALLEETQRQAEALQTQQEELRTTNEELESQTKALLQTQERMQVQAEELRQVNEELEQQTRTLEEQAAALEGRTKDLELSKSQIEIKASELEKASQYKSEFLAKMSHELRTPLNSLMILATLLKENKEGNLSEQQVDFAGTILDSSVDLLNLINDILDLSKLEARKLSARPEPFSLRGLFEQMAVSFRPVVEMKNIMIRQNVSPQVPDRIVSDQQRLQQIIRNLLSNAVKFTENGEVLLAAEPSPVSPSFVRVSVKDTGIGIPEEKKRMIFEAFEQADSSVSRKYGGTGLGLTISRELTNLLGGQISVESEEGRGSRFMIDIPIDMTQGAKEEASSLHLVSSDESKAEAPLTTDPPPASRAVAGEAVSRLLGEVEPGKKSILIVEDDAKFRSTVAEIARSHGFNPIEAGDGETALEIVKQHVPNAILLDIQLPGVSGMVLLERIKSLPQLRHIPIHIMSGLEMAKNALRLGAVGFLGKPISLESMRAALDKIESVISRQVKRVLIVEDDERQRRAIGELVGGRDTELQAVGTGHEAIDAIRAQTFDCVILDLSLPDMSGFELLEKLDKEEPENHPPIVIYTGKDLLPAEEERLRRYSDTIIIKGAKSPERLLDEVNLFLHRVETDLPSEKRSLLAQLRNRDSSFEGRTILVVDDDLRNVFALTSALEAQGFRVTVARNGVEALERLESNPRFDAVLMDIMMPKMDGYEAMRRIRAMSRFKSLPVIALTAKTMKGESEKCIQAGASDYLPKPVNLTDLLSVLRVWLPQAEARA